MKRFHGDALRIVQIITLVALAAQAGVAQGPFQATGFKVGEVSDTAAIVWTRLTQRAQANPASGPMVEIEYASAERGRRRRAVTAVRFPEGVSVDGIRNAVPGTRGQVRVSYRAQGSETWTQTPWRPVDPDRDFTHQFLLDQLRPATSYQARVDTRQGPNHALGQSLVGRFQTAPKPDQAARVVFTVSTGQAFNDQDRPDGYNIYPEMLKMNPDFFVHTGDIVYYDRLAKTPALARYHWQRTYSRPTNVEFHRQVSSYFIKDDHDVLMDDCWPTMDSPYMHQLTFARGQAIFLEQVPMGSPTYRTRRWGKDLQIWMVEGRDYRSPNPDPDGPEKTIWGEEQKAWFMKTVELSDATFRVLISPTPLVGPDRENKRDNHSNRNFSHEGDQLRQFIATQKNMVVVCGDRHWQYMSIHPETKVREYSCGPASDKHAGGWRQSDFRADYHRYLNVIGGFLSATVERVDDRAVMTFRYHDSRGQVRYEDKLTAE